MINRDDIEAGDKVYTRDGGCLVAYRSIVDTLMLGGYTVDSWMLHGRRASDMSHPLDIIRIEKAPKPVVVEVYVGVDSLQAYLTNKEYAVTFAAAFKLTIINGKLEKSEQVK